MQRIRKVKDILKGKKMVIYPIFGDLDPSNIITSDDPKQVIFYLK